MNRTIPIQVGETVIVTRGKHKGEYAIIEKFGARPVDGYGTQRAWLHNGGARFSVSVRSFRRPRYGLTDDPPETWD